MSLLDIAQLELDFLHNINTLKAFKKQTCTEHNFFFFFFPPPASRPIDHFKIICFLFVSSSRIWRGVETTPL